MRVGETGEIAYVRGGGGITRRLTELGLAPGMRVRMVSDAGSVGPVIVRVGDARIGIGRGMARRVLVRPNGF
jgi:ferrous iron transport protein A